MKKFLQIMILLVSVFMLVSCGDKTPDLTIEVPANVAINGDILSWDAVEDADSYLVYIDSLSIEVDGTSFNLLNEPMSVGEHMISVVAVKGESFSLPSTVLTYTVVILANPATIVSAIIEDFDLTYEPGLIQSDFSNEWDYENYLRALEIAQAYADASANVRMTEANAIGFFSDFMNMTQSNDIESLDDLMDEMEMFETYNMTPYATAYVLYNVALVGMDGDIDQEFLDAFTDNEELVIQSLEMVLDFLMTVKNSIPANVITTIDGSITSQEITNAEIFLIKDEMVTILKDNLPSIDDFTILYTTLFYVAGAITGENMASYNEHASYLAEVNHLEFDLVLSMLDDITLTMINELKTLVENMTVEVYNPIWDSYYSETDPKASIDLILYIATYIDDFKTTNSAKFDMFDTLMQDDSAEALYGIVIDNIISQIENDVNVPAEQKTDVIAMLNEFKGEYDTIIAAKDIIEEIGLNAFAEFMDSEASLIMNILTLNEAEEFEAAELAALIEDIFSDAISLNSVVTDELDQAAFQTLLNFMKIPLPMMFVMYAVQDVDYETIYDDISPYIAELLANAIVLEKAFINNLDDIDVSGLIGDDASIMLTPLLDVLTATLTPANETLIMDSIDIIFDDILKQSDILLLEDMTISEVNDAKALVVEDVEFYIDEIQAMSTWDLSDLTPEQQERIDAIVLLIDELFNSNSNNNGITFDNSIPIFEGEKQMLYMNDFEEQYYEFVAGESVSHRIFGYYSQNSYTPELVIYDVYGYPMDMTMFEYHDSKVYSCMFEFYFIEGETYYIGIRGASNVPFTLEIRSFNSEPKTLENQAVPVILGESYDVIFDIFFDANIYSFIPEVDGQYDIYSYGGYYNDPSLLIIEDSIGVLGEFDNEADNNNFYADDFFLEAGHTYYLLITDDSDYLTPFSFIITPYDEGEPDPATSSFDTAIPVSAGQTIETTIMQGKIIYYIFEPTTSGYYDIYSTCPDDSIDPVLDLYNSTFDFLDQADDEGTNWNFYMDDYYFFADQTYYFAVFTYDYSTVTFSFVVSDPS
ncbi:hypothetical protein [Mariniplasma anaerobium]|uniref:Uncharacterized protein n=1 Tax=Mariniplasma anaerobium TaxID=2735436 RepID=A0A7U9TKF4_9MOLU|nr:hypothetical protein [Mariniplasma anaerobium]BCR35243.1 hypothetical protein MPAN_001360 [Mariniplasma anaerobium]